MNAVRILVVEDERIVALHSKQQLSKLGYDVVGITASGEDALQKIVNLRPDVVLMDIHIEGAMDGIETASRIPDEIDTPVIYVTAYSEEPTLARARATKPYGYLIKPYSEREMHATIQMALERRRSDAALRASEDRFRSIFDAISEGIFILDAASQTFTAVNEPGCLMIGYSAEELIGKQVEALSSGVPPYTQQDAGVWVQRAVSTGLPQRFEWQSRTKQGRIFPVEVSMRTASLGGKDVIISIVRDLTERVAIEAQLRQSQKMEAIGQLTGGMAHDFNNLLGVIIGNLELLRESCTDLEIDELAGQALDAAIGGAELTRGLLAFARRQPLQPQTVDLKVLVRDTMKLLERLLGTDIQTSLVLDDAEPSFVVVDPTQLEAALTNLATNARDAMPRGGKLTVAVGNRIIDDDYVAGNPGVRPGEYVFIEVTDTGTGMSAEVINHIFDPFFTTKERGEGTGLGLSMVFGFVKQSGGHVGVYSEIGSGSTFRLYLPRTGAVKDAESVAPRASEVTTSQGEAVLVVEDNASLRRAAIRHLGNLGYRALEAENGAQAMAVLESTKVDVLFTDVVMAGHFDGFELAGLAKSRWPHLKVVLTSGYPETKLKEAFASSPHRFLNKPYRKAALARILREALESPESSVPVPISMPTEPGAGPATNTGL